MNTLDFSKLSKEDHINKFHENNNINKYGEK